MRYFRQNNNLNVKSSLNMKGTENCAGCFKIDLYHELCRI